MATVMACSAFAAICGSNAATAATMTTVAPAADEQVQVQPEAEHRLDRLLRVHTGGCHSAQCRLIIIGLSTEQSIARLFYGGIGAGVILAILLILTVYVVCRINPEWGPVGPKTGFVEKIKAVSGALEMIILFSLVMLGLYFDFLPLPRPVQQVPFLPWPSARSRAACHGRDLSPLY